MSKYADQLKAAKDLLSKSFNYNKKVEYKATTGGVGYTAEAVVGKPAALSLKAEGAAGDLKVDSFKIGSDDKVALELSNSTFLPGAKLSFKGTDSSRAGGAAGVAASVGAESKLGAKGFGTLDIDVLETATLPVAATAVFNFDGFLLGGQVAAQARNVKLTDYNVLAGYKNKSTTLVAQTEKKLSVATVGVYHVASAEITAAGLAKLPVSGAGKIEVQAGFAYKVSADATATLKAASNGKVAGSYAQVLSPLAKLTLAAEIDAANLASDDHKFGINLNLTA